MLKLGLAYLKQSRRPPGGRPLKGAGVGASCDHVTAQRTSRSPFRGDIINRTVGFLRVLCHVAPEAFNAAALLKWCQDGWRVMAGPPCTYFCDLQALETNSLNHLSWTIPVLSVTRRYSEVIAPHVGKFWAPAKSSSLRSNATML